MALTAREWGDEVCIRLCRVFGDEALNKYEGDPVVKWLIDSLGETLSQAERMAEMAGMVVGPGQ